MKSRKNKIRNLRITEIINLKHNMIEIIGERGLRFFGHLKRMGSDRIPKMVLEWNVDGTKGRESLGISECME